MGASLLNFDQVVAQSNSPMSNPLPSSSSHSLRPGSSHIPRQSPSPTPSATNAESQLPRPSPTTGLLPVPALWAVPVAPSEMRRQDRQTLVERSANRTAIEPGRIMYSEAAPDGWRRIVHPEGPRYFFQEDKQVFTDIDLTEPKNLVDIEVYVDFLREKERQVLPNQHLGARTQLVIQLVEVDDERGWCYYFVNHSSRVVFWVDNFGAEVLFENLEGVISDSHIGYAIEAQYWFHCEMFPTCMPLSPDHVHEVWGMIVHTRGDHITSVAPLSTFDGDQLGQFLGVVPYLQARVNTFDDYAVWVVARVMRSFGR
ncbi:hypothetical protein HYDPIDRAFT_109254 [Hydnomerulius pinastri MD-312]|nr:hypothetical protein HYDPIDRAFT_109254 [Hydnomerulius pinastri MD-312]